MTFTQRRIIVDAMSWSLYSVALTSMKRHGDYKNSPESCIDINATLYKRLAPAGKGMGVPHREITHMK